MKRPMNYFSSTAIYRATAMLRKGVFLEDKSRLCAGCAHNSNKQQQQK